MTAITSKRMDGARSTLMQSAAVFSTGGAQVESYIIDILNGYIGYDAEQEAAYDLSIYTYLLPRLLNSKPIYVVEARDSGLSLGTVCSAVTQIANRELSDVIRNFKASEYITQAYYEKSEFFSCPENILLAISEAKVVGFLMARISTHYWVMNLAVDTSCKQCGMGTQLLLTAMSKANALGMSLSLAYTTYSLDGVKGRARRAFYQSFTPKFAIPMHNDEATYHPYYYPVWNLEGIKALK